MSEIIKSNCPRDCYDGCGVLVHLEDGKQPRVTGDPDHPVSRGTLCGKCGISYNGVWQDENARLLTPLRRTGPKGSGQFEPISWDNALATIAQKFNGIINENGAEAILGMQYSGTLSMLAYMFPNRLIHKLGAARVDYSTICNAAGSVAWHLLYGDGAAMGFDPRTARDASCILVWGANPSHSAPHMHKHWLKDSPARVVVIDPVRTVTAAEADLHLQPRPGTDAALAFALLHALRENGAFDGSFIAEHCVGAAELEEDIERCTPQWGEQQTGVPAADILRAAEIYGAGPSLLWVGQSLQRQPMGGNVMRSAGLLPALTGNIGKPGAGFYYLNYTPFLIGADPDYLEGAQLAAREIKTVTAMDLADRLLDPEEFKAFLVWNTNPLASCSNQRKLREACAREDLFTVAIDCFATDTTSYADIILPAASFLEFDDLTFSYFNLCVGAQSKVREPMGEALPNQEIFRQIARAMKLDEPALYEEDVEVIGTLLQQMGRDHDFAELQRMGHFFVNDDEPVIFYQDLQFSTPSGRIEIASEQAEAMGLPRVPHTQVDPAPPEGQFRLISPASNWRLNDSYANEPKAAMRAGPAQLILCAQDAALIGVADGAPVIVSTDIGSIKLLARIDEMVLPGTVLSYKGRWPSLEPGGENLNFIHAGRKCDMAESTSVHGMLVSVVPL
jgi:anaerobic selenocysteine-containing dehydrogenase